MRKEILILLVSLTLTYGQIVFPGEDKGKAVGNSPVLRPAGPPVGPSFGSPEGKSGAQFGEKVQGPLSDEPIDLDAQNHPEGPQARFIPGLFGGGGLFGNGGGFDKGGGFGKGGGLFGGLANIFNPCSRCHFDDLRFANVCCQKGEIHCCGYLGGGYGGHHGAGFGHQGGGFGHGGIKPGLGVKPIGPPGYLPGAHGALGGVGGGVGGIGGIGGIGGYGGIKPGYCPKPHLFEGFFGRSSVQDEEKLGNKVSFRTADEKQIISNDEGGFKRERRQSPEHQIDEHHQGEAAQKEGLQARFLPGLNQFPIFCRDECFSDFDCPGYLKCCMNFRNCRDCARPVHF